MMTAREEMQKLARYCQSHADGGDCLDYTDLRRIAEILQKLSEHPSPAALEPSADLFKQAAIANQERYIRAESALVGMTRFQTSVDTLNRLITGGLEDFIRRHEELTRRLKYRRQHAKKTTSKKLRRR